MFALSPTCAFSAALKVKVLNTKKIKFICPLDAFYTFFLLLRSQLALTTERCAIHRPKLHTSVLNSV